MSEPSSSPPLAERDLNDLTIGFDLRLSDLVDRAALGDLVRSFHALFGISLRIFAADGMLLAEAVTEQAICRHLGTLPQGRLSCIKTVAAARRTEPEEGGAASVGCFTGAQYRVFPIEYESRKLGRAVLGPYLPAETTQVPASLLAADPKLDPNVARDLLPRMPRAKSETISLISDHLQKTLDLILFSGHKSLLTSQMHLASVRESYRELQDKNAKLQDAFDRLRELDRLKSNFLGVVSHELRTPLTSIIGYSEMLSEGIAGPLVGDQSKFVATIHEKGEQLLQLIMSLLDLSKLESGTLSLQKGSVSMSKLLNDVADTITPKARKKSIRILCDVPSDLPAVQGDEARLRQVFLNLTDNAVKFSPVGSDIVLLAGLASTSASAEEDGFSLLEPSRRMVEVRVIDQGLGIPEAERERIFDPFYQVDSSSTREHEGTGLGLSIVKRLVDDHGGRIGVAGNVPVGTIFWVVLPTVTARPL